MRIALYHNLQSGGAKRTVFETVRRLSQRHHVDLFCPTAADMDYCDLRPHVQDVVLFPYSLLRGFESPFGRLNNLIRLANLWRMQRLTQRVASVIDSRAYDVVLAHPCTVTQAPSLLPHLRTPSVYYCHEPIRGVYEPMISRPYLQLTQKRAAFDRIDLLQASYRQTVRRVDRANTRAASTILTNSQFTGKAVLDIYGRVAQVNHPCVDARDFRPGPGERQNFVVSVGALQSTKGFDFVIQGLSTLPTSQRQPLLIISNFEVPGERDFLQRFADSLDVSVRFQVGVSQAELLESYRTAMLTVYAPVREPLGLVPLESQACETPVVGVAEGGVRETILDGHTGRLTTRDPAAFGSSVGALLASAVQREAYGQAGRRFVTQQWNWEDSTAQLEQALRRTAEIGNLSKHPGPNAPVSHAERTTVVP